MKISDTVKIEKNRQTDIGEVQGNSSVLVKASDIGFFVGMLR